nr:nucleotide-binding, alpha-beta plait [Tanacetum cinerariifolium]
MHRRERDNCRNPQSDARVIRGHDDYRKSARYFVLILRAKSDFVPGLGRGSLTCQSYVRPQYQDCSLTLTPELGPGVKPGARLTRIVSLCVGIISGRKVLRKTGRSPQQYFTSTNWRHPWDPNSELPRVANDGSYIRTSYTAEPCYGK